MPCWDKNTRGACVVSESEIQERQKQGQWVQIHGLDLASSPPPCPPNPGFPPVCVSASENQSSVPTWLLKDVGQFFAGSPSTENLKTLLV